MNWWSRCHINLGFDKFFLHGFLFFSAEVEVSGSSAMIFSSVWLVSVRLASVKLVSVENLSESSFLSSVVVSGSIEEDFWIDSFFFVRIVF